MNKRDIYKIVKSYSPRAYRLITEEFENDLSYDFTPQADQKNFNSQNEYAQKLVLYLKNSKKDNCDYLENIIPDLCENITWADEEFIPDPLD